MRTIAMLDAPVSGAVPRATLAKLAIMIGGDDKEALERAVQKLPIKARVITREGGI